MQFAQSFQYKMFLSSSLMLFIIILLWELQPRGRSKPYKYVQPAKAQAFIFIKLDTLKHLGS
jgi:hypothetical protein